MMTTGKSKHIFSFKQENANFKVKVRELSGARAGNIIKVTVRNRYKELTQKLQIKVDM